MASIRVQREPHDMRLKEDEIRKAFEANLKEGFGEDMVYVASEVHIGPGRIDTLAVDEENRPVFIEYKRKGDFGKDALVQLMDYVSWFTRDQTHILYLHRYIKSRTELAEEELDSQIRLICVVSDVEERVKNACYAV
ncbi:MAG: endonuclease NucS domain-containing protein, partial [Candidatus Bathyarchaeia archaeon]